MSILSLLARAEVSHGRRDDVNLQYTMGRNGHACKAARPLEELQYRELSGLAPAPDSVAPVAMQMHTTLTLLN